MDARNSNDAGAGVEAIERNEMKTTRRKRRNGKTARIARRAIDDVVRRIAEEFDPERIILFGSYAYGKPHPYSDMDLLIVMDTRAPARQADRDFARSFSPSVWDGYSGADSAANQRAHPQGRLFSARDCSEG